MGVHMGSMEIHDKLPLAWNQINRRKRFFNNWAKHVLFAPSEETKGGDEISASNGMKWCNGLKLTIHKIMLFITIACTLLELFSLLFIIYRDRDGNPTIGWIRGPIAMGLSTLGQQPKVRIF